MVDILDINYILHSTFHPKTPLPLQINADGVISFGGPAPSQAPGGGVALLAPFWADVDTSSSGSVFYRVSRDADLLGKLSSTINAGFSSVSSVSLNWALLVTWSEVSAAGGSNAIVSWEVCGGLLVCVTTVHKLTNSFP